MSIYAMIYIAITVIGVLILVPKHGRYAVEPYNFYAALFANALIWVLLYMGGFFSAPLVCATV